MARRPTSGMGSVADVLGHMTVVEGHYLRGLELILLEERPFLPAILLDDTPHDTQTALDAFVAARQETLAFLHDVAESAWQRTAVHETHGEVTFQALVQFLVDHDGEHLNQIAAILQEHKPLPEQET